MSSPANANAPLSTRAASWSVKLLDIGYIAVIYFSLGLLLAKVMDSFYGNFQYNKEHKKPGYKSALEAAGMLWLNGVIIYFVRNIVSLIPFPLDGFYGLEHKQVKELTNTTVFTYAFFYYQKHFTAKMKYMYESMGPKPKPKPVLTARQMAIIREQIKHQVAQQNIKDRATMKAVYDAAVSQALGKALTQAKTTAEQRDAAQRRARQLEQQVLIARMQMEQAKEIEKIRAAAGAASAPAPPSPTTL